MRIILAGPYSEGTLEKFQNMLPDHEIIPVLTQEAYDSMNEAECIIVRILKTPEHIITNNPKLKAIIRWGVGYDSVDIEAAGKQGVMVANTPGTNAFAVAELALGMMIMLSRRISLYVESVKKRNWDRSAYASQAVSLNHKTVGIIGGGNIGRSAAKLVQSFGAHVLYYDIFRLSPKGEEYYNMTYAALEDLLTRSDIVSLHIPLSDSTKHILGSRELGLMKPTALVINTSRGGLIDEEALLEAVQSKKLAGAGLDCVEDEASGITAKLLSQSNVLITPHIGGSTADLADEMIPAIAEKIVSLKENKTMTNIVNIEFLI